MYHARGILQQALGRGLDERLQLLLQLGLVRHFLGDHRLGIAAQLVIVDAHVTVLRPHQDAVAGDDGDVLLAARRLDHAEALVANQLGLNGTLTLVKAAKERFSEDRANIWKATLDDKVALETTQIQEQTLGFVAKLVAVVVVLFATSGWLGGELYRFAEMTLLKVQLVR